MYKNIDIDYGENAALMQDETVKDDLIIDPDVLTVSDNVNLRYAEDKEELAFLSSLTNISEDSSTPES